MGRVSELFVRKDAEDNWFSKIYHEDNIDPGSVRGTLKNQPPAVACGSRTCNMDNTCVYKDIRGDSSNSGCANDNLSSSSSSSSYGKTSFHFAAR